MEGDDPYGKDLAKLDDDDRVKRQLPKNWVEFINENPNFICFLAPQNAPPYWKKYVSDIWELFQINHVYRSSPGYKWDIIKGTLEIDAGFSSHLGSSQLTIFPGMNAHGSWEAVSMPGWMTKSHRLPVIHGLFMELHPKNRKMFRINMGGSQNGSPSRHGLSYTKMV